MFVKKKNSCRFKLTRNQLGFHPSSVIEENPKNDYESIIVNRKDDASNSEGHRIFNFYGSNQTAM